jgi:D-amino-acid dehydrogenase
MSAEAERVIVVGSGIIGVACAHYLSLAGRPVTILERGGFGQGCSHGNCGFVCPSHILPLAEPGAVGTALRSLFQRNSPFKVRLRFDPALWAWLWRFARRCRHDVMLQAAQGIHALLQSSRRLYDELMAKEQLHCEWQTRGLLYVYRTQAALNEYARTDALLREQFQLGADRYDGEAVREFEPALRPGLAGGYYYAGDAHLRSDRLLSSWHALLRKRGVTIEENCEVTGITGSGGQGHALGTTQGERAGSAFVFATGALTPFLRKHLGCKIPIQPGKGYTITMPRPGICPAVPLIFPEHRVAVTPFESGYRLGSTMEFAGYDASLNRRRLDYLKEAAVPYLIDPFRSQFRRNGTVGVP